MVPLTETVFVMSAFVGGDRHLPVIRVRIKGLVALVCPSGRKECEFHEADRDDDPYTCLDQGDDLLKTRGRGRGHEYS